jgi:twitching motility two-component system response regulator PilG
MLGKNFNNLPLETFPDQTPVGGQTTNIDYRFIVQPNSAGWRVSIKVMVIDDSNTIRRTAEALLKKAGYDVLTASDGFEAMSLITDNRPDIIFVDIMMPRLDGYQTCQLIKNNKKFRDTPVIMLSSKDGLFDRARGRIAGSEEHVNKPFTQEELIDVITKYVH